MDAETHASENVTSRPLDPATLSIATLASVCATLVTWAVGSGAAAALVVAGITPVVTAFITHPGPHRRRRIVAVALLIAFLRVVRDAIASVVLRRTRARRSKPVRRPWRPILATGLAAFAITVVGVTVPEVVLGNALVVERSTTFFGAGRGTPNQPRRSDRPKPAAAVGPTIRVPAGGVIRVAAAGAHDVRVTFAASALDAGGGILTPDCRPAAGIRFPIGTTAVECTATDAAGRTASARFDVTVKRGARPVRPVDRRDPILLVPERVERATPSRHGLRIPYGVSASDAVDGSLVPDCSPASGSRFPVGATTVACTATDAAGNTARRSFPVVVRRTGEPQPPDSNPPVLRLPPAVSRTAEGRGTSVPYAAHAADAVDGRVPVACAPASGSWFPLGTTTVRCSARDRAGNSATGAFTVTVTAPPDGPPRADDPGPSDSPTPRPDVTPAPVVDRTPPVVAVAPIIETTARRTQRGAVVTIPATALDDVDGSVPASCPGSGSFFPFGSSSVTCSATDKAGNTGTADTVIRVRPSRPPPVEPVG